MEGFLLLPQQKPEVIQRQCAGEAFFAEDVGGESALAALELPDFLLDALFHQQAVGDDVAGLADAVGAVDGLVFDGGIPPRIVEHDVARGGEVQAEAAGAQGDEEDGGAFALLEFRDERTAVLGVAGEDEMLPPAALDLPADEVEQPVALRLARWRVRKSA